MHTWRWVVPAVLLTATSVLSTACSTRAEDPAGRSGDSTSPTAGPTEVEVPEVHEAEDGTPESEPRGSQDWRLDRPAYGRIMAYTTHASAPPGTAVGLKVSTTAAGYRVLVYRIGSYRGGSGTLVWRSTYQVGERQPAAVFRPVDTRTRVAPWRRSLTLDTTGWEPGFYVIKLRTGSGWDAQVPYVVSSPSASGTVALVAPVTTWQAYNTWGGYSLYVGPDSDRRSWAVSFDRPYDGSTGANDYRTAAIPIVVRAERLHRQLGIPLSYYTNVDLDQDADVLSGARGYVSMGHDEYWTPAMRKAVEHARDGGTNLAFLGANTMYWRIRLDDTGSGPARLQTGYRHDAYLDPLRTQRPAEATSRYRDEPAAESEQTLVGMEYECYPVDVDLTIASPHWWGFRGTGVRLGDRFPGLVGLEADRVYLDESTPRPMEVLSHTPYSCRGVATSSQAVYYTTRSGAGVFAAGTLRWGCALVDACERPLGARVLRFVQRVTDNVLRTFAEGPAGRRHPARDTVTRYPLPDVNTVDAS